MRQSNVCSPAQNQACLLITSRLYDRRGLDCTSPLPLFNSLAHLVHLTATSPKIREILTRDGGLERLVRILRDFVANPPPPQDIGGFYGLLPPIPLGNSTTSNAISAMSPSMSPPRDVYGNFIGPHSTGSFPHLNYSGGFPSTNDLNPAASFEALDQSQPTRSITDPRPFDRDAAQRFSLAFQSIVNVGVRGSEAIRSRVVQAGTLEVVASILEAWLINKGFPLVMPTRRGKKRDANAEGQVADPTGMTAALAAQASAAEDTDERMDEDADGVQPRPIVPLRTRASASGGSRTRSERSGRPSSSSNATGASRAAASSSRASTSATRPASSRTPSTNNQTTPRHSLTAVATAAASTSSIPSTNDSSANASSSSLVPTPSNPSSAPGETRQPQTTSGTISRGRSGTIVANRTRAAHGDSSREHSTDEMENDADTERTGGRSGANTEDEDMDAESSNNEVEMETANTSAANSDSAAEPEPVPNTVRVIHRPVAVADPQALSPHQRSDSLSLPTGTMMGMGLEVDVLAAVNMVMAQDGVVAFEGTQFGGGAADAAAAEAVARAGREGIMEEETPRAVLRNMSRDHPSASANTGDLSQVDEEMRDAGDATTDGGETIERTPSRSRAVSEHPMEGVNQQAVPALALNAVPQAALEQRRTAFEDTVALGGEPAAIAGPPDALGGPRMIVNPINPHDLGPHAPPAAAATAQAIAAANAAAVNANRSRFRVMVGDAGPFRQEDVLRALQLLAYLTKYPHVRQEFYKKRVHLPPGMGVPVGTPGSVNNVQGVQMNVGRLEPGNGASLAQVAPVAATLASGQVPQVTTLFSLVERFTFRPSMSHLSLNPGVMIPTIPPEIQSWAAVIMRNACRKDDSQGGIRQCANMTCGKWERTPREFAKCRRCRKAKYCGKDCQSKAWSMGHRYWCSAREGEPGQNLVPPENLDHENEDAASTTPVNGDVGEGDTGAATTAPPPGMGIGIAPNGGVGIVPLNPQPTAPATRGRTGNNTATQQGYATRGPAIAGYAWEAPPTNPTRNQPSASTSTASTSTATASTGTRERRRDGSSSGSVPSRVFGRGLTERIRQLGAAGERAPVATALMQQMGIQAPAPSVIAPSDPNTVRPRAWDRLFGGGRDGQASPGPSNDTARQRPTPSRSNSGGVSGPLAGLDGSTADDLEQRSYFTSTTRNRGDNNTSNPSTDLSGMVRNNLVLANQSGSNPVTMRVISGTGTEASASRAGTGYPSASNNRSGLTTRSSSATASMTLLDPSNATGSMWAPSPSNGSHTPE